jgi:hypothetical protein
MRLVPGGWRGSAVGSAPPLGAFVAKAVRPAASCAAVAHRRMLVDAPAQ